MNDKVIDIYSKGEYPSNVLSNFYPNSFVFDNVECRSMEGFIQSLKYKNIKKQQKICLKVGIEAKKYSKRKWLWKLTGHVFWQGKIYHRYNQEFFDLLIKAYQELYKQNETFHQALDDTKDYKLIHSIGKNNPRKTILTEKEFIAILEYLRS